MSEEETQVLTRWQDPIIKQLQQENKQLKEDFAVLKKSQMISNDILNELEEWLKTIVEYETLHKLGYMTIRGEWGEEVLNKIQELKEKYK